MYYFHPVFALSLSIYRNEVYFDLSNGSRVLPLHPAGHHSKQRIMTISIHLDTDTISVFSLGMENMEIHASSFEVPS
jgi:hypothetical protein